jgi:PKD repeat protein
VGLSKLRPRRAILCPVLKKAFWLVALIAAGCGGSGSQPSSGAVLRCTATPSSGTAPLVVTFGVQVAEPPSETYSLSVLFGDGTSGTNPNVAHTYAQPGAYAASIQLLVGGSAVTSCSEGISVTPFQALPPSPTPPHAVFRVTPDPPVGRSPLTAKFNMCNTNDFDGDTLSYTYAFGDGSFEGGRCREQHTYKAGIFTAEVCVADVEHRDCKDYVIVAK